MKKLSFLFCLSILLSALLSVFYSTTGMAATYVINPTDDLFSVENPPGYVVNDVQLHATNFAYVENTYLKFPLSEIGPSSTITSATLRLFEVLEFNGISQPNGIGVYYSSNDGWSESTSYAELPIIDSLISTAQYPGNWLNWMEWDLSTHDFSSDIADGYLTLELVQYIRTVT